MLAMFLIANEGNQVLTAMTIDIARSVIVVFTNGWLLVSEDGPKLRLKSNSIPLFQTAIDFRPSTLSLLKGRRTAIHLVHLKVSMCLKLVLYTLPYCLQRPEKVTSRESRRVQNLDSVILQILRLGLLDLANDT